MDERDDHVGRCVDCGSALDVAADRSYSRDESFALCSACATKRGARYDESEGLWVVPPDLSGLGVESESDRRRT
jgi:hypothetical protein